MQYLLDTHVILWWLDNPQKIATKARNIIADKSNEIFISSVSIWEMAIKSDLNKISIPVNILTVLQTEKFQTLKLSHEESLSILNLPKIHTDPFDRMLIAQAKFNDLILITKDQTIIKYPIITLRC
jgi:PIN domain nuclease of toxin-antitoxin system